MTSEMRADYELRPIRASAVAAIRALANGKRLRSPNTTRMLATRSQIPPGKTLRVERAGEAILLCNVAGTIYAIEDQCTHDGGELDQGELDGCRIECPRHGAYFDVTTGAALTMPAVLPVRTFAVRLEGDDIFVDG